jgi:hypothetical protein
MRRTLLSIVAFVALAACGGDGGTGPSAAIAGNYSMQTLNGGSLPFVLYEEPGYSISVLSGQISLTSSGTYTETVTVKFIVDGDVETLPGVCTGTYQRSGNNVTLIETETDDCGGTYTARWDGRNALTVNYGPGLDAVFRR